jgi:hypothetical protein
MKKHDFSVFEYRREFVAAGIPSNLKKRYTDAEYMV